MIRNRAESTVVEHLAEARLAVRRERRRVADEHSAFAAFVARLDDLAVRNDVRQRLPVRALTPDRATGPDAVERAYRETVMSVPHYEAAYGEPYPESIRAELGEPAVVALDDGLVPAGKRALVRSATEARDARDRFLDALDVEASVLEQTGETLERTDAAVRDVEAKLADDRALSFRDGGRQAEDADRPGEQADKSAGTFDGYAAVRSQLCDLRDRCDAVAARRQRAIHTSVPGRDVPDIAVFLYDGYPVLAAVADLADRIDAAIRATDRAIASAR